MRLDYPQVVNDLFVAYLAAKVSFDGYRFRNNRETLEMTFRTSDHLAHHRKFERSRSQHDYLGIERRTLF